MPLEFSIQSLAFLLPLRESLIPTKIRQQCRRIWFGFIPMVFSPIGFCRFRYETFRFLLRSICKSDFSTSTQRFQIRIWDPGRNDSDLKEYWRDNRIWPDLAHFNFYAEEPRRWPLHSPDWVLASIGSLADATAVISDLKESVNFNPNSYYKFHNRLFFRIHLSLIIRIHIIWRRLLVFDQYGFILETLSCTSWGFWTNLHWPQRRPDDRKEFFLELSNILFSRKRQDTILSPTTFSSHFKSKVTPKAFWSPSSKLIANYKYVKDGHNRFHMLGRKAFDSRVTFHSFIEIVLIFYICVQWLLCIYHVSCKLL